MSNRRKWLFTVVSVPVVQDEAGHSCRKVHASKPRLIESPMAPMLSIAFGSEELAQPASGAARATVAGASADIRRRNPVALLGRRRPAAGDPVSLPGGKRPER